jgi:hypothetical protein
MKHYSQNPSSPDEEFVLIVFTQTILWRNIGYGLNSRDIVPLQ